MLKAALWISIKASKQARQAYALALLAGLLGSAYLACQLDITLGFVCGAVWGLLLTVDHLGLGAQKQWVALHCAVDGEWHLWLVNGQRVRVKRVCWRGPVWLGLNLSRSGAGFSQRTVLIWPDMIAPAERAALCRLMTQGQPN
ncbi:hypothetical protein BFW38_09705 [Terasakiispira papahanaumokuakeensis]|uniref:Uncharacterized protein n=1 Tax=Terasakiispira papahanaumokuakeensis TaxID=197479 RepID=A0A1E2V9W9_9GAMM|nr:hypothetical protein [Terasakiispira papahanaumokuakeensis]ODC03774.1 hypothetical protein BFW38_09705 [Terasakiispira papahanaumokuakeensis]